VLSKYGLADWLAQSNIDFVKDRLKAPDGEVLSRLTREARIRLTLTELGPTFIKLGQLLSTRPDLVGKELADELAQLQSATPADPPEVVRKVVETELGMPLDELFAEFELVPIASASIGQVHRARLKTGERVVVKVQHHGIESKVNEDLEVLAGLAQLAEQISEFRPYRPTANVAEDGSHARRELDFGREERNLSQFGSLFKRRSDDSHSPGADRAFDAARPDDGHDRRDSGRRDGAGRRRGSTARKSPAAGRGSTCR
jgi:ubiquinone biosynthesis protein